MSIFNKFPREFLDTRKFEDYLIKKNEMSHQELVRPPPVDSVQGLVLQAGSTHPQTRGWVSPASPHTAGEPARFSPENSEED